MISFSDLFTPPLNLWRSQGAGWARVNYTLCDFTHYVILPGTKLSKDGTTFGLFANDTSQDLPIRYMCELHPNPQDPFATIFFGLSDCCAENWPLLVTPDFAR